jgi:hypothetical protein
VSSKIAKTVFKYKTRSAYESGGHGILKGDATRRKRKILSCPDMLERKMIERASPEEMERRRRILGEIHALRSRPVTEEEKEFWRKFDEELERERFDAPLMPHLLVGNA